MAVVKELKRKVVTSASELTISSIPGYSLLVLWFGCKGDTQGFCTVKNGPVTSGYFSAGPEAVNHIPLNLGNFGKGGILEVMKALGIFDGFPVMKGDNFVLSFDQTMDYIVAEYKILEEGDVKGDEKNAKYATERTLCIYGTNKSEISSSGWYRIDKILNPKEMKEFPFESSVPTGYEYKIHAIGIRDLQENSYTDSANTYADTQKLRIWKNTENLFFEGDEGFICKGAGAAAGSKNFSYDAGVNEIPFVGFKNRNKFYVFDPPLHYDEGDEMIVDVYVRCDDDAVIDAESLLCFILCEQIKKK